MNHLFLRCLVLLFGCGLIWAPSAHADVTCQTGIQAGNINFGSVDPSQSASVDVTATINYTCRNTDNQSQQLTLCFNIGYGSSGAAADSNRQMAGAGAGAGASSLEFQLYRDAARTQIAGSVYESAMPQPVSTQFSVPRQRAGNPGTSSGTVNIYGRLSGSQASPVGSYNASFAPKLTGNIGSVNCNNTYDDGISAMSPFNVTAVVPPACSEVSATTLDFGQSTGLLTTNMDQTSAISVTCVNGTPYQVGLDNGMNSDANGRRMMLSGGGDYVPYKLYRDQTYNQDWGNTQNADTITDTSNGRAQQFPVYGRVPPQLTPTPGNYADTVTVYVYY